MAHSAGAQGSCWPQASASRWGTDGAPTETTIGAAQIIVWQRERQEGKGGVGTAQGSMLASSRWLQRVDGHREWMDTPPTWCHTAPESISALVPLLIPCPDIVPCKATAEQTEGEAGEEGRVARNGERLLAKDGAPCPGAEGEDKAQC